MHQNHGVQLLVRDSVFLRRNWGKIVIAAVVIAADTVRSSQEEYCTIGGSWGYHGQKKLHGKAAGVGGRESFEYVHHCRPESWYRVPSTQATPQDTGFRT